MAPGVDARSASVGSTAAISEAMEANRVLVAELQSLEQSLVQEEAKLLAKMQSIRRRMALRRAQQAMDSLLPPEPERKVVDPFTKGPRSRKKLSEVAVRSYIRQQVSFFTDEEQCEPKRGRPKKKQKKTVEASDDEDIEKAILGAMSEPPLNADTEYLRSHSHESFVAGPPTIFTARERKVLKDFAEDFYMTHSPDEEIPLEEWNGIQNWQEMRKSRQLPIERSGFACKLWYDLHDSPKVRLGAWTKQEDAALRRLAKGEVDPSLVNQWHEIAKRMPIQGRPAAHCLTRYQTTLCAGNTKSAFTPEEDQILREAVPVFGEKWNVIADLLDGRVSEQIRHRWQLSLAPGIRRGKFSVIEDRRMILALRVYASSDGEFNHDQVAWNEICHHIPGRTQPAIRDRYFNCLNPDLSFRKFTKQEDQIILARVRQWGIESARLWPRLAAELGDRSDSQVCRRWRFLDPEGYEKRRRALEEASKTQTTAVFRRRSIHRHQPQYSKKHTTRSSYNGNAVEPTPMRLSGPILRIHANGTATLHGTELLQVREGENGSTEFIL